MADLVVTVTQLQQTSTSESAMREHRVLVDRPTDKGGQDRGPMGGELLLAALGGCFMSNLIAAAVARSIQVEGLAVVVRGSLGSAPPRFAAIEMEVQGRADDPGALDKLVTIAERACIVHNTLTPAVPLKVFRA
jgi:putative redox protein